MSTKCAGYSDGAGVTARRSSRACRNPIGAASRRQGFYSCRSSQRWRVPARPCRRRFLRRPADPHPPADRDLPLHPDRVARGAHQHDAAVRQRDPIKLDKTGETAAQPGHRVPLIRVRTSGREEQGNGVAAGREPQLSGANLERAQTVSGQRHAVKFKFLQTGLNTARRPGSLWITQRAFGKTYAISIDCQQADLQSASRSPAAWFRCSDAMSPAVPRANDAVEEPDKT